MDWIGRCVMAIFVLSMKVCMKSWYERLKVGPFFGEDFRGFGARGWSGFWLDGLLARRREHEQHD